MPRENIAKELKELHEHMHEIVTRLIYKNGVDTMSIRDAAVLSGKSTATIRKHMDKGLLRVRFPDSKYCIHQDDFDMYLRGMFARPR